MYVYMYVLSNCHKVVTSYLEFISRLIIISILFTIRKNQLFMIIITNISYCKYEENYAIIISPVPLPSLGLCSIPQWSPVHAPPARGTLR